MYSNAPIHSIPLSHDMNAYNERSEIESDHSFPEIHIECAFRFDITQAAIELDKHIGGYLFDPPKGIYIPGKLHPVVVDGERYFTKNKEGQAQVIESFDTAIGAVYNHLGNVVIPQRYMQPKNHKISNIPYLPFRAVGIIELLVREQVHEFSSWLPGKYNVDEKILRQHVDREKLYEGFPLDGFKGKNAKDRQRQRELAVDDLCMEILMQCNRSIEELTSELWAFLGRDNWRYHFVKQRDTLITVEKGEDYRLHQWNQEHGHKFT